MNNVENIWKVHVYNEQIKIKNISTFFEKIVEKIPKLLAKNDTCNFGEKYYSCVLNIFWIVSWNTIQVVR